MTGKNNTFATMASCNPKYDYVNRNKVGLPFFDFDITAASLSMVSLLVIASIILLDKRLQAHPNQMIAYVFLCDAYTFCQYLSRYLICGYGWSDYLNYFYAITVQYGWVKMSCNLKGGEAAVACWTTVKGNLEKYGQFDHTVQEKLAWWYFITVTVSYVGMFLNTCIIYDLKLVIENPFQSSDKRVPKYLIGSSVLGLCFSYLGLQLTMSTD